MVRKDGDALFLFLPQNFSRRVIFDFRAWKDFSLSQSGDATWLSRDWTVELFLSDRSHSLCTEHSIACSLWVKSAMQRNAMPDGQMLRNERPEAGRQKPLATEILWKTQPGSSLAFNLILLKVLCVVDYNFKPITTCAIEQFTRD